mmetsp:Transcript_66632/g.159252  ORF Transcript_66632/g.159252 Transcript_66632/m.159252 type:complete len:437 (+) Transcript_66632:180-1490(+)
MTHLPHRPLHLLLHPALCGLSRLRLSHCRLVPALCCAVPLHGHSLKPLLLPLLCCGGICRVRCGSGIQGGRHLLLWLLLCGGLARHCGLTCCRSSSAIRHLPHALLLLLLRKLLGRLLLCCSSLSLLLHPTILEVSKVLGLGSLGLLDASSVLHARSGLPLQRSFFKPPSLLFSLAFRLSSQLIIHHLLLRPLSLSQFPLLSLSLCSPGIGQFLVLGLKPAYYLPLAQGRHLLNLTTPSGEDVSRNFLLCVLVFVRLDLHLDRGNGDLLAFCHNRLANAFVLQSDYGTTHGTVLLDSDILTGLFHWLASRIFGAVNSFKSVPFSFPTVFALLVIALPFVTSILTASIALASVISLWSFAFLAVFAFALATAFALLGPLKGRLCLRRSFSIASLEEGLDSYLSRCRLRISHGGQSHLLPLNLLHRSHHACRRSSLRV